MNLLLRMLAFLGLAIIFTGCSTFEQDWRHSVLQAPAKAGSPVGPWKGTWLSQKNGHTGELRCIVTQLTPDTYEYRFKATYWKLFRYSYNVNLLTTCKEGTCTFKGTEDLGFLAGGLYSYEGVINDTNFNSTYSCKFDHGTFQMSRPHTDR